MSVCLNPAPGDREDVVLENTLPETETVALVDMSG